MFKLNTKTSLMGRDTTIQFTEPDGDVWYVVGNPPFCFLIPKAKSDEKPNLRSPRRFFSVNVEKALNNMMSKCAQILETEGEVSVFDASLLIDDYINDTERGIR